MIITFYRVNKKAALLQIPYILWVTFASALNGGCLVSKLIFEVLFLGKFIQPGANHGWIKRLIIDNKK